MTPLETILQATAEWKAKRDAATQETWHVGVCNSGDSCYCRTISTVPDDDSLEATIVPSGSIVKSNAEFCVHAANHATELAESLELAVKALSELNEFCSPLVIDRGQGEEIISASELGAEALEAIATKLKGKSN